MQLQFHQALNREIAVLDLDGRRFRVPKKLNARYEICDILAAGGMGVIFVAKDTRAFEKRVLIKRCLYSPSLFENQNDRNRLTAIPAIRRTLDTEYGAMLHGWARKIPNIPVPLDRFEDINPDIFGPHPDRKGGSFTAEETLYKTEPYLVVNYFTGRPIKSDHPEVAKNILGFVSFYIRGIANILSRFHQPYRTSDGRIFDFFYCDLKPDNVLLTDDNQIVLIDMGSFSIRVDGKAVNGITTTLGYCAPELKNSQSMYLSPCVDVYALALSAFELITQNPPRLDQYQNPVLDWGTFEKTVNDGGQTHLLGVFKKALAENPKDRYQTMQAFKLALNPNPKSQTFGDKTENYAVKTLKQPVQVTCQWMTGQRELSHAEAASTDIVHYPIWRQEKFFTLEANATALNGRPNPDRMVRHLSMELHQMALRQLTQNFTFFPELLELSPGNVHVSYIPGLGDPARTRPEWIVRGSLVKTLYLFRNLESANYRMIGLSAKSIRFDLIGNPFIQEYWLVLDRDMHSFCENPYIQRVVGEHVVLPPEVTKDRTWVREKSFSYLAGISTLFSIAPGPLETLYRQGSLYEKQHYERHIRTLKLSDELKDTLLDLINPDIHIRLSLNEALSKLRKSSDKQKTVTRAVETKGLQVQATTDIKGHRFQYRELGEITNRVLNFRQLKKHILLNFAPSSNYADILKKTDTQVHLKNASTNAEKIVVDLLNKAIGRGETDLAVIIAGDGVKQAEIKNPLAKFKKVILLSIRNQLEDLPNLKFYDIRNFLTKNH